MSTAWRLKLRALMVLIGIAFAVAAAPAQAFAVDPAGSPAKPAKSPQSLRLEIRPGQEVYDLQTAESGNVTITARFENTGSQEVLLAHPNVCLPQEMKEGQEVTWDPAKSAILVRIKTPSGKKIRLRNNVLRWFEPTHVDHLVIPPRGSAEIHLGWFGPYFALGQWDGIDEPIFSSPGSYQIQVSYKNAYPKACLTEEKGCRWVDAWTGELESNTLTLRVE